MRKIISIAFCFAALATFADTWSENPWVYNPVSNGRTLQEVTYWAVYDAKGNEAKLVYRNGVLDVDSLDNAISTLKLSVNSVFTTMAGLAQDIIAIDSDLTRMDQALEDLNGKLNNTFAEIMQRLNEIEIKDKSTGNSTSMKRATSTDGKTVYVVDHLFNAAQVDGKSIKTNSNGKIELYRFEMFKDIKGVQPFNIGGYISYDNPWLTADKSSVDVDVDEFNRPIKAGNKHGIHLYKWYDPNNCDEKLSDRLKDGQDSHYILTQKRGGGDDGKLHYMKIGKFATFDPDNVTVTTNEVPSHLGYASIKGFYSSSTKNGMIPVKRNGSLSWEYAGGGSALRFFGTDATADPVVVGSGAVTNEITFASAEDSNVKVNVSSDGSGGATITIGVYYK